MRKHILLIDDDYDEMTFLCIALSDAGIQHSCTWARSVEHALAMLQYLVPDMIFIDLNMPKTDGVEGIRQIRGLDRIVDVPIVLYSTSISPTTIRLATSCGATRCLQKPQSLYELKALLQQIFPEDNEALPEDGEESGVTR